MTLTPGTRLGRYQIVGVIGAGSMGEVYCARDPQIGRDVAIKVLPASLGSDADRLRRFQQEAQAAGALNHPNLLSIFDVGVEGTTPYVVSELLEGENLRERMRGAALPIRTTLDYSRQIAAGLAVAHDRGIVHRDLKPENVFVCSDGRVKLLDFGLAKLITAAETTASAHATTMGTASGIIVGTAPYMSPEQIRGQAVDHRSDIFSFGAVLYEMLCGARPYEGASAVDIMTAILNADPSPIEEKRADVPAALARVVARCLQKHPAQRFQSAHDLAFTLETVMGSTGSPAPAPAQHRRISTAAFGWSAVVLAVVLLGFGGVLLSRPALRQGGAIAFDVPAPEGSTFATLGISGGPFAVSPDGRQLVFAAPNHQGRDVLWLRGLDAAAPRLLAGTEDAAFPFWSPDSRTVAFFAQDKLRTISADGGPVIEVASASGAAGGAWSRTGTILFATDRVGPLYQVTLSGGTPTPATRLNQTRHEIAHRWPSFLPDGRHFLYSTEMFLTSGGRDDGIYVASIDDSTPRLVVPGASNAVCSDGFLLFARGEVLVAQPFDVKTMSVSGQPLPVAERLQTDPRLVRHAFAASPNGVLAYKSGASEADYQLTWKDRSGATRGTVGPSGLQASPAISPDGTRIAVQTVGRTSHIAMYDLARNAFEVVTPDSAASHRTPTWSPDGSRLIFSATHRGPADLYLTTPTVGAAEELLVASPNDKYARSWSPDSRYLLYFEVDPETRGDLWTVPVSGERKPVAFLRTQANETNGQFSPDGRWVAYESDEAGQPEIYVASFPQPAIKRQLSNAGGRNPRWRGKELFYYEPSNRLMAVDVNTTGNTVTAGTPHALFSAYQTGPGYFYDAAPDGQRFIVNDLIKDKVSLPLTVVVNWPALLKR